MKEVNTRYGPIGYRRVETVVTFHELAGSYGGSQALRRRAIAAMASNQRDLCRGVQHYRMFLFDGTEV